MSEPTTPDLTTNVAPHRLQGHQSASRTPLGDGEVTHAVHLAAGNDVDRMNGPDLLVVAVDGPSGSGKSSVSREVASRRGFAYLDTGAMYRALAWYCRAQGIALDNRPLVAEAAVTMPLELGTDPAATTVRVGGRDVAEEIRSTEISTVVSQVATNLDVRAELGRRQRAIIARAGRAAGGVVAEGRDITTVVAPDADVRILLVASEDARLRRRSLDVHGTVDDASLEATRDQVVRRDREDSTVSSFMTPGPGVTAIDTSDLDFEESVRAVLREIDRCVPDRPHTGA